MPERLEFEVLQKARYINTLTFTFTFTYAVMRCLSVRLSVCLSVCVSVTFVSCVKTNKDIFEIVSPSGSDTILVFPYQTGWRYSNWMAIFRREPPPPTGASNAGGVGRNRDSEPICLLLTLQQARCCKHGRRWTMAIISQVVTIISLVVYCGYSTTKRHMR